jgi:hypothetical protein
MAAIRVLTCIVDDICGVEIPHVGADTGRSG